MACDSNGLTAFFKNSRYHMANVGGKLPTFRRALATGRIHVGPLAFAAIQNQTLPKGDVLKLAEIAGINGAKQTSTLLPLCHPLLLEHIAIHFESDTTNHSITAYCVVSTVAKTGVEMEALAGINAALLCIYDLCKPVEPALDISDIRLLLKEGGKKGRWQHPAGLPDALKQALPESAAQVLQGIRAAVITLSDRAAQGVYADRSGEQLQTILKQQGAQIADYRILADDRIQLERHLQTLAKSGEVQLTITTGGTGLSARDTTPEALLNICERTVPGIGELLRSSGAQHLQHAWLSRSLAGTLGNMLVIALPGSPNAVQEGMQILSSLLPHAIELLSRNHAHD